MKPKEEQPIPCIVFTAYTVYLGYQLITLHGRHTWEELRKVWDKARTYRKGYASAGVVASSRRMDPMFYEAQKLGRDRSPHTITGISKRLLEDITDSASMPKLLARRDATSIASRALLRELRQKSWESWIDGLHKFIHRTSIDWKQ